jgi:hypothetical protein
MKKKEGLTGLAAKETDEAFISWACTIKLFTAVIKSAM